MTPSNKIELLEAGLPAAELTTVNKYTLKQEIDIKKDNWMHFPMTTGIATYAYDYSDKAQKESAKKRDKKKKVKKE